MLILIGRVIDAGGPHSSRSGRKSFLWLVNGPTDRSARAGRRSGHSGQGVGSYAGVRGINKKVASIMQLLCQQSYLLLYATRATMVRNEGEALTALGPALLRQAGMRGALPAAHPRCDAAPAQRALREDGAQARSCLLSYFSLHSRPSHLETLPINFKQGVNKDSQVVCDQEDCRLILLVGEA
jgi:hypothetical protein